MNDQHLKSIVPELKTRRLIIDLRADTHPLFEGLYLVSAGKDRQPSSVYQLMAFRKVNSKIHAQRYELIVIKTPDMIQHARVDYRFQATVKDESAMTVQWYTRKKK